MPNVTKKDGQVVDAHRVVDTGDGYLQVETSMTTYVVPKSDVESVTGRIEAPIRSVQQPKK